MNIYIFNIQFGVIDHRVTSYACSEYSYLFSILLLLKYNIQILINKIIRYIQEWKMEN